MVIYHGIVKHHLKQTQVYRSCYNFHTLESESENLDLATQTKHYALSLCGFVTGPNEISMILSHTFG